MLWKHKISNKTLSFSGIISYLVSTTKKKKKVENFLARINNNIPPVAVASLSVLSVATKITCENDTEELWSFYLASDGHCWNSIQSYYLILSTNTNKSITSLLPLRKFKLSFSSAENRVLRNSVPSLRWFIEI